MNYVDGFVVPVPTSKHSRQTFPAFRAMRR
jgi:hypothetical protein